MGQSRPLLLYFRSFQAITVGFNKCRTRIVGIEGEHADHYTIIQFLSATRRSGKDQLFAEAATPNSQRCNSKLIIVRVTLDLNPSSEVDMFLLTNVRIPCTPCMLCKFTYIVEIDTLLDNEL